MPTKKSPANQALGKAIRRSRTERGYTQEGFSRHSGIDRSYFASIERGEFNCTVDTVIRIALSLDLTATELFARAKL